MKNYCLEGTIITFLLIALAGSCFAEIITVKVEGQVTTADTFLFPMAT